MEKFVSCSRCGGLYNSEQVLKCPRCDFVEPVRNPKKGRTMIDSKKLNKTYVQQSNKKSNGRKKTTKRVSAESK